MNDLNLKMATQHRRGKAASRRVRTTVYLSPEAKEVLYQLRLRSLDKRGQKPAASQIIEGLLKEALNEHKATPYPS
jgi:hypothetical protein